jgi:hypothetical protein
MFNVLQFGIYNFYEELKEWLRIQNIDEKDIIIPHRNGRLPIITQLKITYYNAKRMPFEVRLK